jgi:hypothetical protein
MMAMSESWKRCIRISAMFGVFALGAFSASLLQPSTARAQSISSSIIVPQGGLTFRTPEGRLIARLSSGPGGGVFELYDAEQRPIAPGRGGSGAAITTPRHSATWSADEGDDTLVDPWLVGHVEPHLPASGL